MSFISHWHDAIEILLGISGVVAVGVSGKFHELHEDEIIIVGSRESHCVSDITLQSERVALIFEPSLVFNSKLLSPYKDIFSRVEPHSSAWPETIWLGGGNSCWAYGNCQSDNWKASKMPGIPCQSRGQRDLADGRISLKILSGGHFLGILRADIGI